MKVITQHNLVLIDYQEILQTFIKNCVDDLFVYGRLEDNQLDLSDKDTIKIIYHHFILNICNFIVSVKERGYKVLIYYPDINDNELTNYCKKQELIKFLSKMFERIKKVIPINIFITDNTFNINEFENNYNLGNGESIDILFKILGSLCYCNKISSFEKVKKFTQRYNLEFLTEQYFNDLKVAAVLINN